MDTDRLENPTYDTTPSIQYSALGPRDAPTSHTPIPRTAQGREEGVAGTPYEVPLQSRTQHDEGIAYEVPTPAMRGGNAYAVIAQNGNKAKSPEAYNILQHH